MSILHPTSFTSRVRCDERPPNIDDVPLGQSYILTLNESSPFSSFIESCGHELREQNYWWEGNQRKLESVTIQYSLAGKGVFRLGGETHLLSPGKAMLCHTPGEYAYGLSDDGQPWRFIYVTLTGASILRIWKWLTDQVGPVVSLEPSSESVILMCEICRRAGQGLLDSELLSADFANRLTFSLCEGLLKKNEFLDLPEALVVAQDYIRRNLTRNVGLNDIASASGVSASYLGSLFREYLDSTPRKEIERQRINLAKVLLASSHASVTDVSLKCGFSDAGYFSKVFHRHTQLNPSAFRERKLHSA